mmetsp:Transcript_29458/g.62730  ORF Transcript_29458/g.62730 Transcript_29458/m.62730 type:complete len:301 (+) Transcript_29458:141-1043(+)
MALQNEAYRPAVQRHSPGKWHILQREAQETERLLKWRSKALQHDKPPPASCNASLHALSSEAFLFEARLSPPPPGRWGRPFAAPPGSTVGTQDPSPDGCAASAGPPPPEPTLRGEDFVLQGAAGMTSFPVSRTAWAKDLSSIAAVGSRENRALARPSSSSAVQRPSQVQQQRPPSAVAAAAAAARLPRPATTPATTRPVAPQESLPQHLSDGGPVFERPQTAGAGPAPTMLSATRQGGSGNGGGSCRGGRSAHGAMMRSQSTGGVFCLGTPLSQHEAAASRRPPPRDRRAGNRVFTLTLS